MLPRRYFLWEFLREFWGNLPWGKGPSRKDGIQDGIQDGIYIPNGFAREEKKEKVRKEWRERWIKRQGNR